MRALLLRQPVLALAVWINLLIFVHAAQDINGKAVLRLGDVVPVDTPGSYYSELHPCPAACLDNKPNNWTVYSSIDRLNLCNQPMLFEMGIHKPVGKGNGVRLHACTVGDSRNANTTVNALFEASSEAKNLTKRAESNCVAATAATKIALDYGEQGTSDAFVDDAVVALESLQAYLEDDSNCDSSISFAYSNGTVAGIYMGSSFDKRTVKPVVSQLIDHIKTFNQAGSMTVQLCGEDRNSNHVLGLALDTTGDIATVQSAIRSWSNGECASELKKSSVWEDVHIWESTADLKPISQAAERGLEARAECTTIRVAANEYCPALAKRCGVSLADFQKYNPGKTFCNTLQEGQPVCCTSGTLPDITPKPEADGTCNTYTVQLGDNCSKLAATYGLTEKKIDEFNNGTTWVKESPPMPAPIANALCGPTKPGSKKPTDDTELADLNPCPLNVCCNIWGQCGINQEFCLKEPGPSKNPGTSLHQNGCVSSCGTKITNKGTAPAQYGRVGYYETWNFDRECLNLRAQNANTDGSYTHMHWAFAGVNKADWTVKINDSFGQWDDFKDLGLKRIISFGGWGYSTEPETYNILREAMATPDARNTFATNVAKFVKDEGLDGVDFDWEYPGAIDIDGTPPGLATDGPNYLKFLTTMRSKLGTGSSLSIAAPASYWYLKSFPINNMAKQLDYIVYMTYDLHGQWDAGNQWATEGCAEGNCLRSHVNLTETEYALSMITKAGVSTNKIFVGESSYGRSFKMSEKGCTGPDCKFEGTRYDSKAKKGVCTDTAGYISNAEIGRIKNLNPNVKTWHDGDSNSDIMVYDDTEWVAYMAPATKNSRRSYWQGMNFAGTIDWAVDLQEYTDDDFAGPDGDSMDDGFPMPDLPECKGSYDSLDAIEDDMGKIPKGCLSQYILKVLKDTLDDALKRYDDMIADDYDKDFDYYAQAVVDSGRDQVESFMYQNGSNYFTCIVTEMVPDCGFCKNQWGKDSDVYCRYCEDYDNGWDPICDQPEVNCEGVENRYKNVTEPCPPDYSLRAQTPPQDSRWSQSVYWHLVASKAKSFWADLYTTKGIAQENIRWDNVHHWECAPSDKTCGNRDWDYNFPVPDGYDKDDVLNPKDVVSDAHKNVTLLSTEMSRALDLMTKGSFSLDADDLVDALSLPISMIADAVDSMEKVKEIGEKIEETKRQAILMAFLTAIFFFIPVVGEVAGAVSSMAAIGRIVALLGEVGNVALDIYTIVDDPKNAPLAIFGLILSPLALTDAVAIGRAASARRSMSADDVAKLGEGLNARLSKISNIKNVCRI
ncbi:uncharacterized protein N7500_008690 [Penicillium coprophilum]|uniref:uncharacterized protein n=1 Tax=Penicillium coprophilum TaxID=36646 RepID=UPI0023A1930D|nr:uncharacterized protein N7500_008690 [Penicillium coprophilum]KAJ5159039.1 hypothetical protein N7500_008690 [Penicillium coprophilum]